MGAVLVGVIVWPEQLGSARLIGITLIVIGVIVPQHLYQEFQCVGIRGFFGRRLSLWLGEGLRAALCFTAGGLCLLVRGVPSISGKRKGVPCASWWSGVSIADGVAA